MLDRSMSLTTTFDSKSSLLRYRKVPAGCYSKYSNHCPCTSNWKSAACHAFAQQQQLCCGSPLEPAKQTRPHRIATGSTTTIFAAAAQTTMSSPLMSAVVFICFAIALAQVPQMACAAPRSGRSFVSYPYQRFRYGGLPARHGVTTVARNPGRGRIGGGSMAPNLSRGRKMLFGTLSCAPQDLSLTQGPVSSTSGIPTFDVQIVNLCGVCAMGQIHVACGNWASATPVDPFVFTRLGYNDCLVNNGAPLSSQGSVSFQYSNSAMYPMSITSASSECHR